MCSLFLTASEGICLEVPEYSYRGQADVPVCGSYMCTTMSHIKGVGVAEGTQSVVSPLDAVVSYALVRTRSRTALFFCEQWLPRPV